MKKLIIIGACVVFAVLLIVFGVQVLAPTPETPTVPESTAPDSFAVDYDDTFGYIVTTPKDAKDNMPLIVYLHDESSRGNNPEAMLKTPGFPKAHILGELERIDAYVLIPQLPADEAGWERVKPALIRLIDKVAAQYRIDTTKIALTGHQMGGTGALKLAASYPDKFSCVVSISGFIAEIPLNLEALKDLPIRSYTCDGDLPVTCIDTLSTTNKNCTAIKLGAVEQNATWQVYQSEDHGVFQWMLAQ